MRSEIDRFQIREIFQTVDRCDLRPRKLDRLYRFGFFLRNLTVLIRIEVRHDVGLQHLIGNHGRIGQFLARLLDYDMLRSICILEDNRRVTRATLRIRQHLERELLVDHSAGIHSLDPIDSLLDRSRHRLDVRLKFHRYILLRIGHRYRFRILVDDELPLLILLDFERGLLTATYEIECHLLGRICLIGRRNRKLHDALARFAFRLVHLNPICATFQRPGFRTGNGNSLLAALVRERQGLRTDRNRLRSRHLTNRQFHTRCLRVSQREFSFPRSTRIGVCLKSEFICTDRQIVQPSRIPRHIERTTIYGIIHGVRYCYLTRNGCDVCRIRGLNDWCLQFHIRVVATTREAQSENREKRHQQKR